MGVAPRTELSRDRIVAAAMDLLDEQGRRALSMRTLAARLGVGTMSLYHYVADRDDLLDGIGELLDAELPEVASGSGWRDALRSLAIEWRRAALEHPAAAALVLQRGGGERRARAGISVVEALVRDGFGDDEAVSSLRAVAHYVVGVCANDTARASGDRRVVDQDTNDLEFLFGLDALLDGLAGHRQR